VYSEVKLNIVWTVCYLHVIIYLNNRPMVLLTFCLIRQYDHFMLMKSLGCQRNYWHLPYQVLSIYISGKVQITLPFGLNIIKLVVSHLTKIHLL